MKQSYFKNQVYQKDFLFALMLLFLLLLSYWGLIQSDTILDYDDKILLGPIGKLHSVLDYFHFVKNGIIADIQPVRDFSYWIDIKLKHLLPFYSFHLSNVVYWSITCFAFYKVLNLENGNAFSILFALIYAFSPVSGSSVAWIAARKHILSAMFIMLATLAVIKNKSAFKSISLYILSVLSQPINTLWPIWHFVHTKIYISVERKFIKTLLAALTITFLAVNFYYYHFIYSNGFSSTNKFVGSENNEFEIPLLALGRYFYQCLNPFSALPTSHYQGSWENFAGISLLILFLIIIYKTDSPIRKKLLSPILFFFLPLLIVTIKRTNIFCSDTYLLTSSAGAYWAFSILLSHKVNFKWTKMALGILAICLFIYNFNYVTIFQDEDKLWTYAQEKEANSQSTVIVASMLTQKKKFYDSYVLIKKLQETWPDQPYLPQLIAENIFHNPNIAISRKIETLEATHPQTTSTYLYLSILLAQDNQIEKLKQTLPKVFSNLRNFNLEFHGSEEKIAAIYFYTCSYYRLNDCSQKIEDFKKHITNVLWNEGTFKDYVTLFESQKGYGVK